LREPVYFNTSAPTVFATYGINVYGKIRIIFIKQVLQPIFQKMMEGLELCIETGDNLFIMEDMAICQLLVVSYKIN
jgi:hypothetical protein